MPRYLLFVAICCALIWPISTVVAAGSGPDVEQAVTVYLAASNNFGTVGKTTKKTYRSRDPFVKRYFTANVIAQDGKNQGRRCSFQGARNSQEDRCTDITTTTGERWQLCCPVSCDYTCQSQTAKPLGTPGGSVIGTMNGQCRTIANATCTATKLGGSSSPAEIQGD